MDAPLNLSAEDIEFAPLSTYEWRVSDRRYSKHDIASLLGFVAHKGDEYYLTRMHHPLESVRLGSLDQVASYLARELAGEAAGTPPVYERRGEDRMSPERG